MLEVKNIKKNFEDRKLFEHINLKFNKGKIYAIIGKSGSGKSTLLNMIVKLEKPDEGKLTFDGKNIENIKDNTYFRYYMGILFQNFGLIENKSVRENLKLGLVGKKYNKRQVDKILKETLAKLNLSYLKLDKKIYSCLSCRYRGSRKIFFYHRF